MVLSFGGLIAHAFAAMAFAALFIALLRRETPGAPATWLRLAAALTATWALIFTAAASGHAFALALLSPMETLRTGAWAGFLIAVLSPSWAAQRPGASRAGVAALAAGTVLLQLALDALATVFSEPIGPEAAALFLFARLSVAIGGLVLVHNLYVNTAQSGRWSIQLLCIGLGGLFAYDLNYYTLGLLTGATNANLFNMRGLADAFVAPLIWLSASRVPQWRLQLSRRVVFQTFSLAAIGGYLVLMSVLGWGLRQFGGDWGKLLQTAVIVAMLLGAAVVLVSGRFRAWAKVQINKNFFAYKYDYREEWLRFISTIAREDAAAAGPIRVRVIQAICQIVDSPAGVLFQPDGDGMLSPSARWNQLEADGAIAPADPVLQYLERGRILDLDEPRQHRGDGAAFELPAWAADSRVWLAVPLAHLDRMIGIVVIARSLAPRRLNWEDYDLLRTAGRQAASYLAEYVSQAQLNEASRFDEFNRRFAFIMHDIKNVASQLGLLARNAERHADNPEFRADMIETLNASTRRMTELLARLGQRPADRGARAGRTDVAALVRQVGASKRGAYPQLVVEADVTACEAPIDGERLGQALEHLIQNAIEASPAGEPVTMSVACSGGTVMVSVADRGTGMSPAFIRDELFEPFRSTKAGGFGLGAYEAREIVRAAGGSLKVASREGEGTRFTITLPVAEPLSVAPVAAEVA
ncbi:MAG: PEP-CTERM system histidine kinase PrsK [Sphingomonadaceae bacterium]|nr:PEP-CTERM system histidine kinase PrsK [Sphingomonadaceae bacterium]